ncbi:MAG: hypothetical protein JWQ09_835, partial [Segetibacter sp.]|nr:hypothetical protein [Segetibacter sp.]
GIQDDCGEMAGRKKGIVISGNKSKNLCFNERMKINAGKSTLINGRRSE